MSAWKTMESAPKDGTLILAYDPGNLGGWLMRTVAWRDGRWWYVYDDCILEGELTHWMPLPAPPLPGESNARFIAGPATPSKR